MNGSMLKSIPNVKVVAVTTPVGNLEGMAHAEFVAFVARVSNPDNQMNVETSQRLIDYLKEHKHWSPFEHSFVTVEVTTTRDVARQMLRHRSFTFQEFSQRYASSTAFVTRRVRMQDTKNRQNSIETDDDRMKEAWRRTQDDVINFCEVRYKAAIEAGIAKEVARAILPEGLTVSTLYMTGSIRSWIHYLQQRLDPSTQKEHREVAKQIQEAIHEYYEGII